MSKTSRWWNQAVHGSVSVMGALATGPQEKWLTMRKYTI